MLDVKTVRCQDCDDVALSNKYISLFNKKA
jgi:hypothetical protein